MHGQKNIKLK